MCDVKEVDKENKTVTIAGSFWSVSIYKGRIISQSGSLSPVEKKKCYSIAHTIFPKTK